MIAQHADPNPSSSEAIPSLPPQPKFSLAAKRPTAFWPGLLLAWLLALPALSPLLQPHTLTNSADGLLHMYRLVALENALSHGSLFPRWLPDLAFGYGLPLFVFYAPLSYYPTLLLSLPAGVVNGLNASLLLALLAAVSGVYLFTGERFGAKAGLLSGVAYGYAPMLLLNTFLRASMPAVWAMAVFPFVFWAFGRLIRRGDTGRIPLFLPLTALLFGLALLLHNISNVLFIPFLGLYLVIELTTQFITTNQRATFLRRIVIPVVTAGLLGIGLAAFFLVPAIFEKDLVQINRVIISPNFDFRFHFTTLPKLLSLPEPANTGLLNPRYPFILGLAQVWLALLGLFSLRRWQKPAQRAALLFAWIGLAVAIFMMLPLSFGLWERISLLAFVQHPTRFLAPAAFMLAVPAGAAVWALPERFRLGVTLAGIVLIFLAAGPLLYPRYLDPFPAEPTLLDMLAYEHSGGAIGTTSFGEYLPRWVQQVPGESPLEPMYHAGAILDRLDASYLPPQAMIVSADYGFNRAELVIDSPQPYQAIFHTFYFPGWTAWVDGQAAPIAPVTERGLIGVTMPAGSHHLRLEFRETPLRWGANVTSLVSLALIAGLWGISLAGNKASRPAPACFAGFSRRQLAIGGGLAVVLVLTKVLYLDRFDNPLKHSFDSRQVAGAAVPRQVNFADQVNLLGYDLDRAIVAAGQPFNLTAYWQSQQALGVNYSSLVQLVDEWQNLYAAQDNLHPGELPATRWQPWGFVQDPHRILVPPGTPPGDYFLVTGLYDPATWARLPVLVGGDPGWADVIAIPVTVVKSARPPTVEELGIAWPAAFQTFGVSKTPKVLSIHLLGATTERDAIRPNDFLRVALFWEAVTTPTVDYRISLRLVNEAGQVELEETGQPSFNRYPTTQWSAGERVRDNHALWIAKDFPAGTYHLEVQLTTQAGHPLSEWLELGQLATAR